MGLIETAAQMVMPEAGLPLRIWSWVKGSASYLLAHPMTGAALLAGVFGAVEHHEANKWAAAAAQRGATIAAIETASKQATAQAQAAKEASDAKNAKLAADADQTAADLRNRYHAAVLQLAANQGTTRRADLSGDAEPAQGSDRSSESAVVPAISISPDDAMICGDNTARLQAVQQWAVQLGK